MIHQTTIETEPIYHVIARRATGERVEISETSELVVAVTVLSLMRGTATYSDIFIECNGKRLAPHRDN